MPFLSRVRKIWKGSWSRACIYVYLSRGISSRFEGRMHWSTVEKSSDVLQRGMSGLGLLEQIMITSRRRRPFQHTFVCIPVRLYNIYTYTSSSSSFSLEDLLSLLFCSFFSTFFVCLLLCVGSPKRRWRGLVQAVVASAAVEGPNAEGKTHTPPPSPEHSVAYITVNLFLFGARAYANSHGKGRVDRGANRWCMNVIG